MPGSAALERPRSGEVSDVFDVAFEWLSAEKMGDKKKGRLGRMTFEFQTADTLNRNRRIYPSSVVKPAMTELALRAAKGVVFGEVDHPRMYDGGEVVRLGPAAVMVSEVTMTSDTNVKVVLDILDNAHGRQLVSILEAGGKPGVSQRAFASWRDPNDEEKVKFKIPDDAYVDVAEALRLITYDIVSEPGFADATGAKVTENATGATEMSYKTPAELKAANPALYDLVAAEGRAAALSDAQRLTNEAATATGAAAIEKAKPAIVAEATKPLTEKITALEAERKTLSDALAQVKPALVALKLVDEKITDASAAARVAAAETKAAALEEQIKAKDALIAENAKKIDEHNKLAQVRAALETVSKQYANHPAHDLIITQLAPLGISDANKALAQAASLEAFIVSINPQLKPQATASATPGAPAGLSAENLTAGLLKANHAPAGGGSGGTPARHNPLVQSIGQSILGGEGLGFN